MFPALFRTHEISGTFEGYRYRFYSDTGTYLGAKDGRIWLYQPGVSPLIQDIASMVDYLPQAMRDTAAATQAAVRPAAR